MALPHRPSQSLRVSGQRTRRRPAAGVPVPRVPSRRRGVRDVGNNSFATRSARRRNCRERRAPAKSEAKCGLGLQPPGRPTHGKLAYLGEAAGRQEVPASLPGEDDPGSMLAGLRR